jgi:hypothetical protein
LKTGFFSISNSSYGEMICVGCTERHPFLSAYRALSVNVEDAASVIGEDAAASVSVEDDAASVSVEDAVASVSVEDAASVSVEDAAASAAAANDSTALNAPSINGATEVLLTVR